MPPPGEIVDPFLQRGTVGNVEGGRQRALGLPVLLAFFTS
jgi:hypothetical protein